MGKGRSEQARAKAVRAKERREDRVEAFELAGVTFIRVGKNIYTRSERTPEQQQEFLASVRDEMLPQLRQERELLRARLDEVLAQADPVDLIETASLLYLPTDPDTFREWESDRNPAHIEYLALQVLPLSAEPPRPVHPMLAAELVSEAVELVRQLFDIEAQLLTFGQADDPDSITDPTAQYRARAQLESIGVRGSGYAEHLRAILLGTLGAFNSECEQLLGFTAEQALTIVPAIVDIVGMRLVPRVAEALAGRATMLRQLPRQRRKGVEGPVPDWIVAMTPTDAKRHIEIVSRIYAFHDARVLATVTAEDVASACGVQIKNVEAFLTAFSCSAEAYDERYHRFPVGAHPLTDMPLLRVDGGVVLPVPFSMLEALRPRMEDLLRAADAKVWQRYLTQRADFAETEAVARLSAALPGAAGAVGLKWKSASDESDLDGLVAVDDFALRVQAKAGRLHASTRRGSTQRMKRNLGELIQEAARQHGALDAALTAEGAEAIGLGQYRRVLEEVPFQIEVIVCLDDVTVYSTEAHHLRTIGVLPQDRPIPWILSLSDLMAVTDLLQGTQLLLYITRRLRLESHGRVAAHDELDWVGYFLERGLYLEDSLSAPDAPQLYRLMSFTERIDAWYARREGARTVETPKPEQEVPSSLAALVGRLETERPPHWTIAALALLMGDGPARDEREQTLVHAGDRRFSEGWSNASHIFEGIGVTYYLDYRPPRARFALRLKDYVDRKLAEGMARNWVAVGDAGEGQLHVVLAAPDLPALRRVLIHNEA
jgi:hypothetical protein